MGHEFVGIVQSIGTNVKNFKVGQRVTVDPNSGCDLCNDCHKGCYNLCINGGINNTIGIFRNGGWATHAIVPETQVCFAFICNLNIIFLISLSHFY